MKYVYTTLVLIITFAIGVFLFQQSAHTGGKTQRIACHKTYTVFERIYNDTALKNVKNALYSGKYELHSSVEKAKFMPTRLFNYVHLSDVDKLVKDAILAYKKSTTITEDKVNIDYYIYENDKADPGKKTQKSKLYAGYVRFTFTYQGIKAYVVQVDFMDAQGRDIHKSVQCAIESVVTAS